MNFILRTISGSDPAINQPLGKVTYQFVPRKDDLFQVVCPMVFLDQEPPEDCVGIIKTTDQNFPVYKGTHYYMMTDTGATFEKIH